MTVLEKLQEDIDIIKTTINYTNARLKENIKSINFDNKYLNHKSIIDDLFKESLDDLSYGIGRFIERYSYSRTITIENGLLINEDGKVFSDKEIEEFSGFLIGSGYIDLY